jgi:hypothetical protein
MTNNQTPVAIYDDAAQNEREYHVHRQAAEAGGPAWVLGLPAHDYQGILARVEEILGPNAEHAHVARLVRDNISRQPPVNPQLAPTLHQSSDEYHQA